MIKISVSLILLSALSAWSFPILKQETKFNKITLEIDVRSSIIQTDLLFVIDSSGSMTGHQANLSSNINKLVSQLSYYDLRAAVTTADMGIGYYSDSSSINRGKFVNGYVSNADSDYLQKLEQNILAVGVSGSGEEQHFDAILAALTINKDFLRPNAHLAIVVLTDAEDQSKVTMTDFVKSLKDLKPVSKSITLNAILVPSTIASPSCNRDSFVLPLRIEEAINIFGGTFLDICENFGTQIQDIGQFIGQKGLYFNRTIQLPTALSDLDTVKVTYGNTELSRGDLESGWIYNSKLNAIVIGQLFDSTSQPEDTKLYIEYAPKK